MDFKWLWVNVGSSIVTRVLLLRRMLIMGEAMHVWEQRYRGNLCTVSSILMWTLHRSKKLSLTFKKKSQVKTWLITLSQSSIPGRWDTVSSPSWVRARILNEQAMVSLGRKWRSKAMKYWQNHEDLLPRMFSEVVRSLNREASPRRG